LTAPDFSGYVAQHLASYKRPSQIVLIPNMPLTPTGKVVKAELVKMLAARGDAKASYSQVSE
jgi:non-ribosomal peptide synthetase component E (peptide arylation enzyme)